MRDTSPSQTPLPPATPAIEGAAVALVLIPLVYALLPPATREKAVEVYPVGSGGQKRGSAFMRRCWVGWWRWRS